MRILFTTISEPSHFRTLVPLAWALLTAGHEVRVASSPSLLPAVLGAGLPAVVVGEDHGVRSTLTDAAAEGDIENELTDWTRPDADSQDWDTLLMRYQVATSVAFAGYNDSMIDDLVDYARTYRPDLVLWEPLTYAGPIVAAACGARQARVSWMVDIYGAMREVFLELAQEEEPDDVEDPLAEWMTDHLERHGAEFDESLISGEFTVDLVPPSLQLPTGLDRIPMRPLVHGGDSVEPVWTRAPRSRPLVCITPGVSWQNALGIESIDLPAAIAALGDLDADLVAAIPDERVAELHTRPDNLIHAGWVPLTHVLPHTSALIHHAGFGSWSAAILAGVPQHITTIVHGDQSLRAEGIARAGAGVHVPTREATLEGLVRDVTAMIESPTYAEGAGTLREEALSMDPPAEVVHRITDRLKEDHRG